MVREPPKMQDMGPKKYRQMIKKENDFYDKYKAGKKDPKTGEFYHHLSATDPRKVKSLGGSFCGYLLCKTEGCEEIFTIKSTSGGIICSKCSKYINITQEDKKKAKEEYENYKQSQEIETLDE